MYLNPSENVYKHGLVVNKLIDYFTEKKNHAWVISVYKGILWC